MGVVLETRARCSVEAPMSTSEQEPAPKHEISFREGRIYLLPTVAYARKTVRILGRDEYTTY